MVRSVGPQFSRVAWALLPCSLTALPVVSFMNEHKGRGVRT